MLITHKNFPLHSGKYLLPTTTTTTSFICRKVQVQQYYCKAIYPPPPKKNTKKLVFLEVFNEWVQYYFYYLNQEVAWPSQGCALAELGPGTQLSLSGYEKILFFSYRSYPGTFDFTGLSSCHHLILMGSL